MLEALPWTQLSFIERGQVLLLIILAAIQIETGRISNSINRFAEAPKSVSRRLAESLAELTTVIQGKFDRPISRYSLAYLTYVSFCPADQNRARWDL